MPDSHTESLARCSIANIKVPAWSPGWRHFICRGGDDKDKRNTNNVRTIDEPTEQHSNTPRERDRSGAVTHTRSSQNTARQETAWTSQQKSSQRGTRDTNHDTIKDKHGLSNVKNIQINQVINVICSSKMTIKVASCSPTLYYGLDKRVSIEICAHTAIHVAQHQSPLRYQRPRPGLGWSSGPRPGSKASPQRPVS